MRAFPIDAPTVRLSATASTSRVALPTAAAGAVHENVRIVNHGPYAAFVNAGDSGVNAALPTGTPAQDNTPLLPGSDVVFSLPGGVTHIAAICASGGTATLDISTAEGW